MDEIQAGTFAFRERLYHWFFVILLLVSYSSGQGVPPEFISSPQNVTVIEEQNINLTLTCTVYGNPTPNVTWTKDRTNITVNQGIIVFEGNTSSLAITNIVRGDEGQYRCVANNGVASTTSAPGKLTVNFRADVKISGSEEKYVEINKQIYLMCQYNASPPVSEVQWVKDGSVIARNDSGIGNRLVNITEFTESQSQLLISSSTRNDEGNYTCFVTNAVGNSSDITSVLIQVVPDPPHTLMVDFNGSRVVNISWTAGFNGKSPIENYTVEISQYNQIFKSVVCQGSLSSSACVVSSSSTNTSLTGLLPWTTYNIRVFATNAIGKSNSSQILIVTTDEEVPSEAPNFDVIVVNSTAVNVSWQVLSKDKARGAIFGYYVLYRVNSTPTWINETVEGAETTSLLIEPLNEHTTYEFAMQAFNSKGVSIVSALVEKTTDQHSPSKPPEMVVLNEVKSKSVRVSWKPVPVGDRNGIILGYRVNYQALSDGEIFTETLNINSGEQGENRTIILQLPNAFTNYSITVLAFTEVGDGPPSLAQVVQTLEDKPNSSPGEVAATAASSKNISVSWNPVTPDDRNGIIKGYIVNYQALPGGDIIPKFRNITSEQQNEKQTVILENLNEFTNYSITVLAFTIIGNGQASSAQVVETLEDKPKTSPEAVAATAVSSKNISVSWNPVTADDRNGIIKGYIVNYQALPGGDIIPKFHNITSAQQNEKQTVILEDLNEFTNYNITVLAFTIIASGPASGAQVVETLEDKPNGTPEAVVATAASSKNITVSWNPVTADDRNGIIKGYIVNYQALPDGDIIPKFRNITSEQQNDKQTVLLDDLNEFTNYSISVLAFTVIGNGPASVAQVVETLEDKPSGAPQNLRLGNTTSTSIFVMWEAVSSAEQNGIIRSYNVSYRVILGNGSGGPINSTLVSAPKMYVNLTGLIKDMYYNISVLASTIKGDGIYSNPKKFRTNEDRPSGPPQRVRGRFTSSTSIMVDWDVVREDQRHGEIISYTVRYKKLTDGTYKETKVTPRSDELKELDKFTVYKIEVLAATRVGDGPPSEPIEERTDEDKPEKPPQSVTVTTLDSSRIEVTWEPVPKDFQHGIITEYVILYNYSGEGKISEHKVLGNISKVVVGGLKQSTEYTIRVLAATVKGRGPASSPKSATTEDPPKPPEPGEGDVGKTEVNIPFVPKQELSDGAPVTKYQVIVMELTDGQDQGKSSDPKYAKVTRKYEDRKAGEPYVTAEFANNNEKRTSFPVGDGKYYSTEGVTDAKRKRRKVVEKFLNGELDDGAKYVAFQRSFDKEGDYESEGFVDFETNKDHTVTIVVVVVIIVIITVCIAVGIFVYRRRQSSPRNGEEEMALRPQKRGRTLSQKILGRGLGAFDNPAHNPGEAVPVEEFEEHVRRLHANGDLLFSQEYGALKPQAEFTWNATLAQENRHKNRYNNVVAYDHSRVKLSHIQGVPGSDYINANFLEGYQKKRAYIASQGPLPETEDDFWRMIWEQDSKIIVMVTNLEERGRIKCHQYWPSEGGKAYGDIQVTLMQIVELSDFTIRTFTLKKANSRSERTLHQYHYTVWPDHGVPSCPTSLLTFVKKASGANPADAGPMVVHCSAGVGRTGTFIVVDAMLQSIAAEKTVDVFGYVMTLRRDRNIMVQVEEQYVFIHEVLLEAIHSGYTEIRANDLRSHMKLLMQVSPSTGQTEMDEEFIRLGRGNTPQTKFQAANMGYNKTKNRYANVLAFDDTRVKLSMITGIEGSDYINANFIDGYMTRRAFIATQAPIPDTIPDFWRMIWEQESSTIVMLSKETESGKVKVHRYWPAKQPANIGTLVVEMTNEMVYEDYTMREIKLTNTKESASRVVRQYHYTGWPDVGSPESGTGLIDLIGQVQRWQQNSGNTTITVHCSAGVGRTGVFCALSILIERLKSEGVVDVFQTVKQLRAQRPAMVQTKDQYEFIYSALSEYLDSFDAYSNFE